MPNTYFQFKQFTIHHDRCAMKVTTDGCLFGAWCAEEIKKGKKKIENALDVGTGTGLLSLMVAQKNEVEIDAVEIDAEAVGQAKENIAASPWKDQVSITNADVLLWKNTKQYDCILSNPPFYQNELRSDKAEKNTAHHDTGLTLDQLFVFIKNSLQPDGIFFLLLPAKREEEVEQLLNNQGLFINKKIVVRQTTQHQPFRLIIKGGKMKAATVVEEMAIKGEDNQYTPEFIALLKDYYLYL
ncbi:MAG TPA: methyltransferase [Flavisolibacter sp.]|nr:methyltransferase [Flavisolibacter sp.]